MVQASYRIGQRLPAERDLAKTFGVSRPTVREAILSLAMAGMLKVRSNSGVYVISRQETPDVHALEGFGPFENLEARQLIEPQIAAIAAQRASETSFAQLAEALAMMRWEHAQGREADTSDHRFHVVLAEATGNRRAGVDLRLAAGARRPSPASGRRFTTTCRWRIIVPCGSGITRPYSKPFKRATRARRATR